eukprot:jgi/Psemu1/40722/gm1.40722_g
MVVPDDDFDEAMHDIPGTTNTARLAGDGSRNFSYGTVTCLDMLTSSTFNPCFANHIHQRDPPPPEARSHAVPSHPAKRDHPLAGHQLYIASADYQESSLIKGHLDPGVYASV